MTDIWKEYVSSLKEQIEHMSYALALSKESAGDRISMLKLATEHLRTALKQDAYRVNPSISDLLKEISESVGSADVGLIAADNTGKCVHFNAVANRTLGAKFLTSDSSTTLDSGFYLADRVTPCGENLPWKSSARGHDMEGAEVFVKRPDVPNGIWLKFNSLSVKDFRGTVHGAIAFFVDVTEHVQTETHIDGVRRGLEQRLAFTATAHNDLSALASKLGKQNWGEAESPEAIVMAAAQLAGEKEKHALVVDDILVHHALLNSHLVKLGFIVSSAYDGSEAVKAVAKGNFSLIMMDCDMPEMDGYEATRAIRAAEASKSKHTPIIAMTGYDRAGDRDKCLAAGMDEYLTKGSSQRRLFKVIEAVMKGEKCEEDSDSPSPDGNGSVGASELDLKSLEALYGKEQLRDIVGLFLKTSGTLMQCLKAAIEDRDVRAAHHYAYCMKGPAASLGQADMAASCQRIAETALRSKWFDADDAFVSLESVVKNLRKIAGPSLDLCAEGQSGVDSDQISSSEELSRFHKLEKQFGKQTTALLAKAFLDDTRDSLEKIGGSLDRKNHAELRALTHKLAGCSASILDKDTQQLCRALQELAEKAEWKQATDLFLKLSDSLLDTRKQVKDYAAVSQNRPRPDFQ